MALALGSTVVPPTTRSPEGLREMGVPEMVMPAWPGLSVVLPIEKAVRLAVDGNLMTRVRVPTIKSPEESSETGVPKIVMPAPPGKRVAPETTAPVE